MYDVSAYNTYEQLPNFAYNIIEHLMLDSKANLIWKLLKYNDADAYLKPDLTIEEKGMLVYNGKGEETNFNVFLDFTMDDATNDMKTFLRIYPSYTYPKNRTTGLQSINFEVLSHSKINHLSNYTTRIDVIIQKLIEVLNGINIDGLGVLFFDSAASNANRVELLGQKPFKGKVLTMSVNIG